MIPPRPWRTALKQPWSPPEGQRLYIVDRDGRGVIPAALDADLAQAIVDAMNKP
jgi:hypothetical protein